MILLYRIIGIIPKTVYTITLLDGTQLIALSGLSELNKKKFETNTCRRSLSAMLAFLPTRSQLQLAVHARVRAWVVMRIAIIFGGHHKSSGPILFDILNESCNHTRSSPLHYYIIYSWVIPQNDIIFYKTTDKNTLLY